MSPLTQVMADARAAWLAGLQVGDEVVVEHKHSFGPILVRIVERLTPAQVLLRPLTDVAPAQRFNRRTGAGVGDREARLGPVTEEVRHQIAAQALSYKARLMGDKLGGLSRDEVAALDPARFAWLARIVGEIKAFSRGGAP